MALLHFMKPVDGLPDSRGALSSSVPAQVIAERTKKCRRQLEAWELSDEVLTRSRVLLFTMKRESTLTSTVPLQ